MSRIILGIVFVLSGACAAPAKPAGTRGFRPSPTAAEREYAVVRIFYATDRAADSSTQAPMHYGSNRSPDEKLSLGACDVSVPRDHRMGNIERQTLWKLQFRSDPAKHVMLQKVEQQSYDTFYDGVREKLASASHPDIMVFVHGFDVTFEDAALRTGQLSYDLGIRGAAVLYSWPSEGQLSKYPVDGSNAEWTAPHLTWFLEDLVRKTGAENIHVVAHSMGNRPLLRAIASMVDAHRLQGPVLNQVVLMAPDVDAAVFLQLAGALKSAAKNVTLYASSNDEALKMSKRFNGYRRAGEVDVTEGIVRVAGVDSIDVSAADTTLIGHSYYGERRTVLSDLFYLLRGITVSERAGLQLIASSPLNYYRFVPD